MAYICVYTEIYSRTSHKNYIGLLKQVSYILLTLLLTDSVDNTEIIYDRLSKFEQCPVKFMCNVTIRTGKNFYFGITFYPSSV